MNKKCDFQLNRQRKNVMHFMPRKIKEDNIFFGLSLTEEQKIFRDAIYDDEHTLVICDAKAGSGKTTIAVACAKLLIDEHKFESAKYIFSAVQESVLGYTPGSAEEKESKYYLPLIDALLKINEQPEKSIYSSNMLNRKNDNSWIEATSHTFMRGSNIDNKIIIIDEAQNFTVSELKKVLTRCHDNSKVIMIGHSLQIDLKNKKDSGFVKYLNYFQDKDICKICTLSKNFRGVLAQLADDLEI